VPLIVGQFDPASLQDALRELPGPLTRLGDVLDAATPWIGIVSFLGALGLMGFLGGALSGLGQSGRAVGDDGVAVAGKVLGQLRELGTLARPGHEEEAARARSEADRRACESLMTALAALERLDARSRAGDLEAAVEALIIRAEIGARRPIPFRLPMAAALVRYFLEPESRDAWLQPEELREVLAEARWPVDAFGFLESMDSDSSTPREFIAAMERFPSAEPASGS
jgi:hypothetical protein